MNEIQGFYRETLVFSQILIFFLTIFLGSCCFNKYLYVYLNFNQNKKSKTIKAVPLMPNVRKKPCQGSVTGTYPRTKSWKSLKVLISPENPYESLNKDFSNRSVLIIFWTWIGKIHTIHNTYMIHTILFVCIIKIPCIIVFLCINQWYK